MSVVGSAIRAILGLHGDQYQIAGNDDRTLSDRIGDMGAWGPGVFSDDLGCEVRDQYRQLISQGQEGPVATDALLESFRVVLLDEDSTAVFWLALAVTQWRVGRLEDRVKNRAIAVIENTTALWAWQNDAAALAARRKVLANVLTLLHSPQRAKTVLRKPFKNSCEWESGELIAFQLRSRQYVIFRVIGHWTDNGGTAPVMEILDWCGTAIPEAAALHNAPIRSYVIDVPAALQPVGWTTCKSILDWGSEQTANPMGAHSEAAHSIASHTAGWWLRMLAVA